MNLHNRLIRKMSTYECPAWSTRHQLLARLLIGEGAETVKAAQQLTGLPGIATGGAGFMGKVNPLEAEGYILLVDDDADASLARPPANSRCGTGDVSRSP